MSLRSRLIVLLMAGLVVSVQGCAGVVIAGGATAGAMANDRRSSGAYIDDEIIEWKVIDALNDDAQIREQTHLNIVSFNGIVLLTGEVPNDTMRERAIGLIKSVQGVRTVHDETSIAAPSSFMSRTGDSWITTKVKTALLTEDADIGASTKVVTEKGVVYLMGIVSPEEADKLAEIVRRVGGVQKVVKVFEYQS
jgi:osmotically-inducible protein OsmY